MSRRRKDPRAVALGKKSAKARMAKIPPERRREIARGAAAVRWEQYRQAKKSGRTPRE